jgi:hypothetical protein
MMPIRRLLPTSLLASVLLIAGCGKSDDQETRFNQTLGGTPAGAPTAAGPLDIGILQDPANYKPAQYEPLEGEEPVGAAAVSEGQEAEAIRRVLSRLADAIFHLEIEAALDAFVPEQVAALAEEDEYMQNFGDLKDAVGSFITVVSSKSGDAESQDSAELEEVLAEVIETLTSPFAVSVLDEENAVATFHLDRLEIPEKFKAPVAEAVQAIASMQAQMGAAAPGGPAPTGWLAEDFAPDMLDDLPSVEIPLPLRKVDDRWRLALPFTIEDQHAELMSEGALIFKDLFTDFAQTFGQAETLDEQTAAQIFMQVSGRHVPAIMGWSARLKLAVDSLMESQPVPEEETAKPETDQAEPNEPEEEAPERPPGRRPGRGRRP